MAIGRKLIGITLVLIIGWGTAAAQDGGGLADDPAGLPGTISLEELKQFIEEARQQRLGLERRQVAAEIEEGLLFDPARIDQAVQGLSPGALNTWQDNVDRICKAFASVDRRFGRAWTLLEAGQFSQAAEAAKPIISVRDTNYFAAAKRYCYAKALAGTGRHEDAVDAYTSLVKELPDRFSFSALSLLEAAQVYERMHRRYYAMSLYLAWVDSFGLLDPKTADELARKAEAIAADYDDPLGTLAGKMSDVAGRLANVDSGRETQQRQKDIVAMLDDLIATAEESSSSSSQSQNAGQQSGQGKCEKCGSSECQGEGQCQGQGQGKKPGPASGIGIPSSPATVSRLVGGEVTRPQGLSEVRPSDGSDDWGRMPARERQKLLETFKESMPERYRPMIRDYYRRLASQGTR